MYGANCTDEPGEGAAAPRWTRAWCAFATLDQAFNDGVTDVVTGRRPLSDFDQVVKDWLNNGGEQIRTEYQQSMAAAG